MWSMMKGFVCGWSGHQPEVIERGLDVGVDLRVAEGLAARSLFLFGIRAPHRRIEDHGAGQAVAVARSGRDRDEAAHAVAHHDRRAHDAGVLGDRHHLLGPDVARILRAPPALAMAGEVERHHLTLPREQGRDEAPPVRVRRAPVHEHHARPPARLPSAGSGPGSRAPPSQPSS